MAILAVAGAFSVAACGSSNTSKTSSPSTSPSTAVASPTTTSPSGPAPKGETQVRGLIASVAGNAVQVTQQNGTATVDFNDSTKITEVSPAALTDVTAGSCVSARSKDGSQTATSVRVSAAADGKCPQGKEHGTQGTVASVAGNTITVNTGSATETVTVSDKTKYTKDAPATSQAITAGKCIAAKGSETGGALQAKTISLRSAVNGKCPEGSGTHRH